jgi:hypothetical protein
MTSRRLVAALLAAALLGAASGARAVCAPSAQNVFPTSAVPGSDLVATVRGDALTGATVTVVGDAGLAATVQSADALGADVHIVVDAAAVPGERILVLDTPGGSAAVSFTVIPPGGPVLDGASPPLVGMLGQPLAIAFTGHDLGGIGPGTIAVSGAGVSVTSAVPGGDGTSLAVELAIAADADLGTHALTISNGVAAVVVTLYVLRPVPTVTQVSPAAGEVGATVPITITGTGLTGAALVISGTDVGVADVVTPNDTTLTATLTIAPTATPSAEARLLIVTTESGQTTIEFFVVPAGVPTVTAVLPGAGEPGTTVPITLRGLNLTGVSVTEVSADLTLENQVVVDDETITLDVVVDPGAAAGMDHQLSLVPGGVVPAVFRVIPVGEPFFNGVRPPFGNRGATVLVRVDGVNLLGLVPGTGMQVSGSGVIESNALALDDRTAQCTVEIDPNANIGASRNVTVTTGTGSFTKLSAFRVNNPGQRPDVTDVSPRLVVPGTTTTLAVTGTKLEGGGVVVTGPGATVTNVVVDPTGTILTFDLTLAPDAPAESRGVIVVTAAGTARCNIASDPAPPPFTAARLVKPGALFTVDAGGFRLFVFEFSLNDRFAAGLRTVAIPDADGVLALSRRDVAAVELAFRDARRGFVRVRAVTATNRIAASAGQSIRR